MKEWLEPDLSENEYRYELYTWFDNLADWQRTEALLNYLVTEGIDISGLLMTNDAVSNC